MGVPALAALVGLILGRRRAAGVRRSLGLSAPATRRDRVRLGAVVGVIAALTVAAAQPAVTHDARLRVRQDVQALFVVDISRSMAASSSPGSPSRLDRATTAAVGLRAAIPTVAAGIATLTDRVLPNLLPVPDPVGFEQVMARGVAIESPPPENSAVRATSFDALGSIPGGGYFAPRTDSRLVVVLTDGESSPVQTSELARAFESAPGLRVVFIRFWRQNESIFDAGGERETAYRPDPSGKAIVDDVAAALRGNAYSESDLAAATRRLRDLAGNGPTQGVAGTVSTRDPLAPYFVAIALLLLVTLTAGPPLASAWIRWPR